MTQRITVTCYAGYKADERPTSFKLGERTLVVREIVDRWYDRDYNCFKVVVEDGTEYLLRHDMDEDEWDIVEKRGEPAQEQEE